MSRRGSLSFHPGDAPPPPAAVGQQQQHVPFLQRLRTAGLRGLSQADEPPPVSPAAAAGSPPPGPPADVCIRLAAAALLTGNYIARMLCPWLASADGCPELGEPALRRLLAAAPAAAVPLRPDRLLRLAADPPGTIEEFRAALVRALFPHSGYLLQGAAGLQ